jgi:hypothetical protein
MRGSNRLRVQLEYAVWFCRFYLDNNSGHLISVPFLYQPGNLHGCLGFDLLEVETSRHVAKRGISKHRLGFRNEALLHKSEVGLPVSSIVSGKPLFQLLAS